MDRRRFLQEATAAGLTLTPLAALLAACGHSALPDGMVEVKWGRDTCTRCSMALSDRRFAAQVRGGPNDASFKFDDIGCVAVWLKAQPWGKDAATRIWVADVSNHGDSVRWLEAKAAQYVGGKKSPMGYNFGAVAMAEAGVVDFETMRLHVLAKGK